MTASPTTRRWAAPRPTTHRLEQPHPFSRFDGGRRLRSRGGGWLLPDLGAEPCDSDADAPRMAPERALSLLEGSLDARSALDRCRWLRLMAEASRWGA